MVEGTDAVGRPHDHLANLDGETVDGQMINPSLVERAQQIVDQAETAGIRNGHCGDWYKRRF